MNLLTRGRFQTGVLWSVPQRPQSFVACLKRVAAIAVSTYLQRAVKSMRSNIKCIEFVLFPVEYVSETKKKSSQSVLFVFYTVSTFFRNPSNICLK